MRKAGRENPFHNFNMLKKNNLGVIIRRDVWYKVLLERIAEAKRPNSDIIKFPDLFSAICVKLSIKKKLAWKILLVLHKNNLITIIQGHGVRLNYEIGKSENNIYLINKKEGLLPKPKR